MPDTDRLLGQLEAQIEALTAAITIERERTDKRFTELWEKFDDNSEIANKTFTKVGKLENNWKWVLRIAAFVGGLTGFALSYIKDLFTG